MKKNDKLIVVFGVIILVLASVGIYYWDYEDEDKGNAIAEQFIGITGDLEYMPFGITVSDSDPFYAIIATPLAVNYNSDGVQSVSPLLVKNLENPSKPVLRFFGEQIGINPALEIDDSESAKDVSIELAKNYWKQSEAALLIENNEKGYTLGVAVAPLASYLRIPIIVTDEIDEDVNRVLSDLDVKYTMVCGDIDGYGTYVKFDDIDEVLDFSIEIVRGKFKQNVNYITLTNPKDAFPPKVLDSEEWNFGPVTLKTQATTQLVKALGAMTSGKTLVGTFEIPHDYKYALVKFEGVNLDYEDVDELGDSVSFSIGINDEDEHSGRQKSEIYTGSTRTGGVADRDSNGNIIKDYVYAENVLYDRGGAEYSITASGTYIVKPRGEAAAKVIVEKLENPVYPMMKGLSTIAPYLTAYRKGIIFAREEFNFTADDDVITSKGQQCPGPYMALRNIELIEPSNKHMAKEIHEPLNTLLAKLAHIDLNDDRDIETLRNYYKEDPAYIALVGGAAMLPQYYYDNYNQPVDPEIGNYYYGAGTPSDVYYGNIDPVEGDWSNEAQDQFSDNEFPFQENIVGRITGYDAQDASALVARTVFYEEIINGLGSWKDKFGMLIGGGMDFRKPPVRYIIFGNILGMVRHGEPIKYFTGAAELAGERQRELVAKPLGFEVLEAWEEHANNEGYSEESLERIRKATLINKVFFRKHLVRSLVGENVVKGGQIMEDSNFLWVNGHGSQHSFGMAATRLTASGLGGIVVRKILEQILPIFSGGFMGPGTGLSDHSDYGTRACAGMDLGPSFYWLESCICGKIDGLHPKNSVGQAIIHSGVNALVAASTTSNIAGGYLEPKKGTYDPGFRVVINYITGKMNARKGIYPEPHFGYKLYDFVCENLREEDCSIGLALRNSRNAYLESDADWKVWWSPPLVSTGDPVTDYEIYQASNYEESARASPGLMMKNKYTSYQEYLLFADPAFNPYEPVNNG